MIEQIGKLIADKIKSCNLVWTDAVFGVVKPLTYDKNDISKTEAFLCNDDIVECDASEITTAEPRSGYNSLIFIEPFKPKFVTDWSCNFTEFKGTIQVYAWINKVNLAVEGIDNCNDEFVFKQQLIQCLEGFVHNSETYPNFFELCLDEILDGSEVSDKYYFSKSKNTLLDQTNYEFVLNFDATIKVNFNCLDASVIIKELDCVENKFVTADGKTFVTADLLRIFVKDE